jgi:hypothetical protein
MQRKIQLRDRYGRLEVLVRVESLVCALQIIGPRRSTSDDRDALPRVRRHMPRLSFLVPLRTRSWAMGGSFPFSDAGSRGSASLPVALSRDAQGRIARERVPTSCTFSGRARPDRAGARPYQLHFLGTCKAGSRGSASLPVATA